MGTTLVEAGPSDDKFKGRPVSDGAASPGLTPAARSRLSLTEQMYGSRRLVEDAPRVRRDRQGGSVDNPTPRLNRFVQTGQTPSDGGPEQRLTPQGGRPRIDASGERF